MANTPLPATFNTEPSCDDIYYEGSEDEDYANIHTREMRYAVAGQRYLNGKVPLLLSASLRGPFDAKSGWRNPWRSRQRCQSRRTCQPILESSSRGQEKNLIAETVQESLVDNSECYLPSPESLRRVQACHFHPYLEKDELSRVQRWRDNIQEPHLSQNSILASSDPPVRASVIKRKANETMWLRRVRDKRLGADLSNSDLCASPITMKRKPNQPLLTTSEQNGCNRISRSQSRCSNQPDIIEESNEEKQLVNSVPGIITVTKDCVTRRVKSKKNPKHQNQSVGRPHTALVVGTGIDPSQNESPFANPSSSTSRQSQVSNSHVSWIPGSISATAAHALPSQINCGEKENRRSETMDKVEAYSTQPRDDDSLAHLGKNSLSSKRLSLQSRPASGKHKIMLAEDNDHRKPSRITSQTRLPRIESGQTMLDKLQLPHLAIDPVLSPTSHINISDSTPAKIRAHGDHVSFFSMEEYNTHSLCHFSDLSVTSEGLGLDQLSPSSRRSRHESSNILRGCHFTSKGSLPDDFSPSSRLRRPESRNAHQKYSSETMGSEKPCPNVSSFFRRLSHQNSPEALQQSSAAKEDIRCSISVSQGNDEKSLYCCPPRLTEVPPRSDCHEKVADSDILLTHHSANQVTTQDQKINEKESNHVLETDEVDQGSMGDKDRIAASQQSPWAKPDVVDVDALRVKRRPTLYGRDLPAEAPWPVDESLNRLPPEAQSPWPCATAMVLREDQATRDVTLTNETWGGHDRMTQMSQLEGEAQTSTPEPQFSITSFAAFMSPSPEYGHRSKDPTASQASAGDIGSSPLQRSRSTTGSNRRVTWAPLPHGTRGGQMREVDGSTEAASTPCISWTTRRPMSPPLGKTATDLPTSEANKFSKHFVAVASQGRLRQRLIPTASQEVSQSPGLHGMAHTFLATDQGDKVAGVTNSKDANMETTWGHGGENSKPTAPANEMEHLFHEMKDFLRPWDVAIELDEARRTARHESHQDWGCETGSMVDG